MNFETTTSAIMACVRATIVTGEAVPLMVWGPPGIGKSAAALDAANKIAELTKLKGVWKFGDEAPADGNLDEYFGFIDLRASQMDPVDAGGFPVRDAENDTMRRVLGSWFPHVGRKDLPKYGMVFCDELSSAPPSVQASLYQFMQDRRLYDRAMKPGWGVIGAGNRLTDGGVTFKMATPLANRLVHVTMESDLNGYTAWGMDTGSIPLDMVAFLRFRPDLLNTFEEHMKSKKAGMAFATERTWHKLAKMQDQISDASLWVEMAAGTVGNGPAAEYLGFKSVWDKMPSIDGIFLNPESASVPDDPATLYAVMTALASRASKDNMDTIVTYIDRVSKAGSAPFAVLCAKDATRRNVECAKSAAFARWAAANSKLLG